MRLGKAQEQRDFDDRVTDDCENDPVGLKEKQRELDAGTPKPCPRHNQREHIEAQINDHQLVEGFLLKRRKNPKIGHGQNQADKDKDLRFG